MTYRDPAPPEDPPPNPFSDALKDSRTRLAQCLREEAECKRLLRLLGDAVGASHEHVTLDVRDVDGWTSVSCVPRATPHAVTKELFAVAFLYSASPDCALWVRLRPSFLLNVETEELAVKGEQPFRTRRAKDFFIGLREIAANLAVLKRVR